jgi:Helix-hairpin-helix motif
MAAVTRGFAVLLGVLLAVVLWTAARRPVVRDGGPVRGQPLGYRIDLNTADAPTLELLPGVGPSIARNIVEARRQGGGFTGPDDLEAVKYVGPRLIERVGPFVQYGGLTGASGEQRLPQSQAE